MEAMAKHRSHSIEFKRQIAQEFIAGETLHGLAKRATLARSINAANSRRGVSPDLIRVGACPRYAIDRIAGASDMAWILEPSATELYVNRICTSLPSSLRIA
jgi:hypothetical protein